MWQQGITTQVLHPLRRGFTIVELLIVIVVIAILAALTIVAYNGITQRATASTVQADLHQARASIENAKTLDGSDFPTDIRTLNSGTGLPVSTGNSGLYLRSANGFCVSVTNVNNSITNYVNSQGVSGAGLCPATVSILTSGWWAADFLTTDKAGNSYISSQQNKVFKLTSGGVLSTYAGTGTAGTADGASTTVAQFSFPAGTAMAADGTLYVVDRNNHCIRRITPDGQQVSTYAGLCGTSGMVYGTGTAARFNYPLGMAIDSSGSLYVADRNNNRIRKIDTSGLVSTYAGLGTSGSANGNALTQAQFSLLSDVAVDSNGTVYALDNNKIRKITTDGTVSTLAGSTAGYVDGTGGLARFSSPGGMTIDQSGNLYIADQSNNRIRVVSPDGYVRTLAGTGASGTANGDAQTAASFTLPRDVTVDANGVVYLLDWTSSGVRKITQN